jgi:hypothetical protein
MASHRGHRGGEKIHCNRIVTQEKREMLYILAVVNPENSSGLYDYTTRDNLTTLCLTSPR